MDRMSRGRFHCSGATISPSSPMRWDSTIRASRRPSLPRLTSQSLAASLDSASITTSSSSARSCDSSRPAPRELGPGHVVLPSLGQRALDHILELHLHESWARSNHPRAGAQPRERSRVHKGRREGIAGSTLHSGAWPSNPAHLQARTCSRISGGRSRPGASTARR